MNSTSQTSIEGFYKEIDQDISGKSLLPDGIEKEIGHFNVFEIAKVYKHHKQTKKMPYNRRTYYKISLIKGRNQAEYADRIIPIDQYALLFASPKIPYNYVPQDDDQDGFFCIFTEDFMLHEKTGIHLDKIPLFQSGGYPIFQLTAEQVEALEPIFKKMMQEINSDYAFKYDLLRNYIIELIHQGQKLQPATVIYSTTNATDRVSSLFTELLHRQFPIESTHQRIQLRNPKDFAERLSIHVNYLNKVLKEKTEKTTSEIINQRIVQEAQILLKQTQWTISEVGYCLGFEEVAHFSNFFKKYIGLSPNNFRS